MNELKRLLSAFGDEADGDAPLIRLAGGTAKRRMDGTWECAQDAEIEVTRDAFGAFARACEGAQNIIAISPPRAVYRDTGIRYVIKLTVKEEM